MNQWDVQKLDDLIPRKGGKSCRALTSKDTRWAIEVGVVKPNFLQRDGEDVHEVELGGPHSEELTGLS